MIGREDTGTLSTNHMRTFRPCISKAETGFTLMSIERCRLIAQKVIEL
jgi:hypothetical protein